jgi:hydrogenase maturation protease
VKTLVLGLGNPILTDDGVGVRVAEAVQAALVADCADDNGVSSAPQQAVMPADTIDVQEVSVGGLTLMECMLGYERVILVDACELEDAAPGTIRRMSMDDLRSFSPTQHSASPHDASLTTAMNFGQQMGLPLPTEIVIYAIGVENVMDFSDQPTPAVAAAIPTVTAAVLAELRRET